MRYLVTSRWGGTLLVLLGFAAWIGSGIAARPSEWELVISYTVAGIAFFLVGCFLPEYQDKRFILGRRSVLQLMAFFFWLAANSILNVEVVKEWNGPGLGITPVVVFGSLVGAFASYYGATFLIRGFRAPQVFLESERAEMRP